MSPRLVRQAGPALAGLLLVAACGDASSTTTGAPPPPATTVATTAAPTTQPPAATTTTATTTAATTTAAAPDLAVTAERIDIASDRYSIAAELPQLSGHRDPQLQERVNQRIREEVESRVEWYRASFEETDYFEDVPPSEMGLGWEATLLNERVLSLRFSEYWYYSGAAHPDDTIWTLLFNLETGDPYALPELLSADSAPQALLTLTEQRLIDEVWEGDADGLRSWVDVVGELYFGEWALTPTTFDVSYGKYEVAPGVAGSVTVSIPYDELGALINPDGPIADLVAA